MTRARSAGLGPLRAPIVTVGTLVALTIVLAVRSPHVSGSYGACPLLLLTGMYCAGCGVLRASHDLVHLDFAGAWQMNPLWVLVVPVLIAGLTWWFWFRFRLFRAERQGQERPRIRVPSSGWAIAGLVVLIGYSIARNVPALMPWLAPGGGI